MVTEVQPLRRKKMKQSEIAEILETAQETASRKVEMTFKIDAIGDLPCLLRMLQLERPKIQMSFATYARLTEVIMRDKWEFDDDRTFQIMLAKNFDCDYFVKRLSHVIKSIEPVVGDIRLAA